MEWKVYISYLSNNNNEVAISLQLWAYISSSPLYSLISTKGEKYSNGRKKCTFVILPLCCHDISLPSPAHSIDIAMGVCSHQPNTHVSVLNPSLSATYFVRLIVVHSIVFFDLIDWSVQQRKRRCSLGLLPDFTLAGIRIQQSAARHAAHEMLIRFDDTFATLLDLWSSPIIAIISTYMTLNWYRLYYCSLLTWFRLQLHAYMFVTQEVVTFIGCSSLHSVFCLSLLLHADAALIVDASIQKTHLLRSYHWLCCRHASRARSRYTAMADTQRRLDVALFKHKHAF